MRGVECIGGVSYRHRTRQCKAETRSKRRLRNQVFWRVRSTYFLLSVTVDHTTSDHVTVAV